MKALVIGGGIHGVASALLLARNGIEVTVLEKSPDILCGVSGATHTRAHAGYHYPRSPKTVQECQEGLLYFRKHYPDILVYPQETYYAISREGSYISAQQFFDFCMSIGLYCELKWPSKDLLRHENLENCFLCREPLFNIRLLRQRLWRELTKLGVHVEVDKEVVDVDRGDFCTLITRLGKRYFGDLVVNATYTDTNRISQMFGCALVDYRLQTTEIVEVITDLIIPSLTVLDGPFCSIQPQVDGENSYLAYDVLESVNEETKGFFYHPENHKVSKWPEMQKRMESFFPFADQLKKMRSHWGSRPLPYTQNAVRDDSRETRILSNRQSYFSILEGKFISAFTTAQKLWEMMEKKGLV